MASEKETLGQLAKQYESGSSIGGCSKANKDSSPKQILEDIKNFYSKLKWDDALDAAGQALCKHDKRDPHQYRYKKDTLNKVKKALHKNEADLKSAKSFDALYGKLIKHIGGIKFVGDLMVYDTTLRLWSNLSKKFKSSDRVYLHNGAWEGAKELFQKGFFKTKLQKKMMRAEFPESLQTLPSEHIEHFLCVMKSEISKLK